MSPDPGTDVPARSRVANAKVGAERNPQKTEVIYCVNDLDTAPLEWRIGDVQNMASLHSCRWKHHARSRIADQLSAKADVIRAMHEGVQLCQNPETEFALLRESLGVSRINHILRVHGHTILQAQRAAEIQDELGQRSLERVFLGLTEDGMTQATLSAGQSGIGFTRDIAAPARLGAPIAAKQRIQAMIQDELWAGLLPEHPLKTRLARRSSKQPPPPISAHSMSDEQATAKLSVQKAAQTAWQQTNLRTAGAGVTNPIVGIPRRDLGPASQDKPSDVMDFSAPRKSQLSAPQLQAQLSRLTDRTRLRRLKNTLPLQRSLAAGDKNLRPVPYAGLPQVAQPPGRVRGKCPDAA